MPILVSPVPGSPLRQGDILRGRSLFFPGVDDEGPCELARRPDFLLLISRDCNAFRDEYLAVFPVRRIKLDVAETEFVKLRRMLEVDRDGGRTPDVFYLGPIGEGTERYAANLGTPFTIAAPTAGDARSAWIESHRVMSMDRDFIDHLHSRIFGAFARKGFDDHAWLPTQDLAVLVRRGEAQIASLDAEVKGLEADLDNAALRQATRETKSIQQRLPKAKAELAELERAVAPYRSHLERRHQSKRPGD